MLKTLSPLAIEAFERRGISPETADRFEIHSGRFDGGKVVPDPSGNVVVFPFLENGVAVAEKYRAPGKKFSQRPGGRRTFWNADALDDPALIDGRMALVITEGELDALSAIESGFPLTVSVPDGAPPVPVGEKPDELAPLDPGEKTTGKFEFLWNNRERLKRVRRFIIAADADAPGQRLAAELVRRLSPSRCLFVTYPDGCKDLNDVLVAHGSEAVSALLNGALPYPVHGLYRLSEFPDLPELETVTTGWSTLDEYLRPFLGELLFIIGIPGHGKSAFIANLCANFAEEYGWRTALFSPEEPVVPHLRNKLRRVRLRDDPTELDRDRIAKADAWINDRFVFIAADPAGKTEDEFYLDWILDRATDAVLRDGINVLVIDPWNEIEQARKPGESQTEYTGRALRMINQFRRTYGVMVIVAVHPTKEVGREGKSRTPTPYDADGSAHFFNKADHFLVIDRPDNSLESVVRVAKVKFAGTGEKGHVKLKFDKASARFDLLNAAVERNAF